MYDNKYKKVHLMQFSDIYRIHLVNITETHIVLFTLSYLFSLTPFSHKILGAFRLSKQKI